METILIASHGKEKIQLPDNLMDTVGAKLHCDGHNRNEEDLLPGRVRIRRSIAVPFHEPFGTFAGGTAGVTPGRERKC